MDPLGEVCTRFSYVLSVCREVQRILMELLNQMDGFDQTTNVKVRRHAHRSLACNRGCCAALLDASWPQSHTGSPVMQ